MKNKIGILDYIKDVPENRKAFISKDKTITYKNIFDIFDKNSEKIKSLKDLCVVINAQNRVDFALLVSLLDNHVKRIVFIAQDIDESLLKKYYEETSANCEVFLNDEELQIKNICNNIEKLKNIVETQWILPTSGTTSIPKLVAHTFSSLIKTAKRNIEKGAGFIWALTFDIYRFSGIQVFLQSLSGGSTLVIPESNFSMKSTIDLFLENSCNIISATPSFYRKALMSQSFSSLNLKRITLGGEISDENILKALKSIFHDAKIRHIYASTEVGVVFSVSDEKAGFPLSYISDGINNVFLKIDENDLLWIKPKEKIQNYLSLESMYDESGFINTGDIVKVKKNRVYFKGRESGAINVGGNKVQPEEIESILLSSKLVKEAHVYAKNSPILGSLVCADIVVFNDILDEKAIKKDIINYCNEHLARFKVPALLKIVDSIELTQNGKLKRN